MRVGLALGTHWPLAECELELEIAHTAQCDSLWCPDHLLGIFHPALWPHMSYRDAGCSPDAFLDPFVLAGALARQVTIPLGTAVCDTSRRRAPDLLRSALSVHHLAPGGFILGVGSGEAQNLVPFGYEFDRPVAALERFLIEARSLLDDGRMPGESGGPLGLPAERADHGKLQIWMAAHGPRTLRLAGTYADGWLPAFLDPATYREQLNVITGHAARAERPRPRAGFVIFAILGESRREVAARMAAEPLAKLIALIAPAELWEAFGMQHPAAGSAGLRELVLEDLDPEMLVEVAPKIPFELVEQLAFIGNAHDIATRLAPYAEAGVEEVVIGNFSGLVGGLPRVQAMSEQFVNLRALLASDHAPVASVSR